MAVWLALAGAWLGGLFLAATVEVSAPWALGLGLLVLAAGTLVLVIPGGSGQSAARRHGLAATLVGAALLAGVVVGRVARAEQPVAAGIARVDAVVRRVDHRVRGVTSDVVVVAGERVADRAAIRPGARVRVVGVELPLGARVKLLAAITPIVPYRNPTPHPAWPGIAPPDARAQIPPGARARVITRDGWAEAMQGARNAVRAALDRSLAPDVAGVARALVLGDGDAVDPAAEDAVRGAGLAHVLAVSGLHVTILVGLVVWGLRRALLYVPAIASRVDPHRVAAAFGIPIVLAYAAFAGGEPSAWRAAVTAAIAWALVAAARRPHPLGVAAAAVIVLTATAPHEATRPALLLSIVATAAVLTTRRGARPLDELRVASLLRDGLALSVRTTIATAPIVLWCFGSVPIAGVVANLVLVPLGSVVLLPLAALHALIALAVPPLADVTGLPLEVSVRAFLAGSEAFARLPLGGQWPPPSVPQGIALAIACAALLTVRTWRTRGIVLVLALVALGALECKLRHDERPRGELRVTFLDVGQGDAALIDLPDGRAMLIDAGGEVRSPRDPGREAIVPLLRARRRDRLDVVVLSHPHPDHYGGLPAVLDAVEVRELWDTGQAEAEAQLDEAARTDAPGPRGASAVVARARRRGTRVRQPTDICRLPHRFGAATVEVLAPCPRYDPGWPPNDNSLVLRIALGRRVFLFTGDAEAHEEATLVATHGPRLRADVLKVGHHGSRTSTTPVFLAAVRPSIAVISSGATNRYGHPHPEPLAHLTTTRTRILRLDHQGGLILRTDGTALAIVRGP